MRARGKLLLFCLLYWLAFFTVQRAVFLLWFGAQTGALPVPTLLGTFGHGFGLDLAATAYLSLLPFLLIALSTVPALTRAAGRLLLGYTVVVAITLAFLYAADLGIFRAWGRRIDAAVLQYLGHPREAWASAGASSPWLLLGLFAGMAGLFVWLGLRLFRPRLRGLPPVRPAGAVPLLFAAVLLFVPARGGVQQIPINQSSAYFSADPFANQAALNAGWNFFDSWLRGLNQRDNPYAVMPMDSARAIVARAEATGDSTLGRVLSVERPNVLLIVWESFTARSVRRLGGVSGVTPEFERLADSGLLFRRLYAAGDRTDKGIAALLAGAPTVPSASILMVPSKANTLPALSKDLDGAGYHTAFYYGGELEFANLKGFVVEGRFQRIVGVADFPAAARTSKWGAHDEAVASRVSADLDAMPEPFFATWLTLSSHEPFEVPGPARVPGSDGESRFLNSLAYTDHVLGEFLARAATTSWWARTLVIIVADHSRRLERTDRTLPYKSAEGWYHIPMLWTGGALARRGQTVDRIMSQTDLAPTLLAQLGIPGRDRYQFGRDVLTRPARNWAYYGFDDGFGLVNNAGSLVWEHAPNRITSRTGEVSDQDLRLGLAMLQLSFEDYLKR